VGVEKPYSDLVTQAERAVGAVKDPELRRVAFERVLDDLLSLQRKDVAVTARSRPRAGNTTKPAARSKARRGGPQAYVDELVEEGFFRKPKTISAVKVELENRGHHIPLTSLSGPLQKLCQKKVLRRQRIESKGKKKTFAYSNW
jgi:hypothetical protein